MGRPAALPSLVSTKSTEISSLTRRTHLCNVTQDYRTFLQLRVFLAGKLVLQGRNTCAPAMKQPWHVRPVRTSPKPVLKMHGVARRGGTTLVQVCNTTAVQHGTIIALALTRTGVAPSASGAILYGCVAILARRFLPKATASAPISRLRRAFAASGAHSVIIEGLPQTCEAPARRPVLSSPSYAAGIAGRDSES